MKKFEQGELNTSEQQEVNSVIMEQASEIAGELTEQICEKKGIKCFVYGEDQTSYTDEAQDIFNRLYDEKMEEFYEFANRIVYAAEKTIDTIPKNIDWELLKQQKETILNFLSVNKEGETELTSALDGIINLLDAIQDQHEPEIKNEIIEAASNYLCDSDLSIEQQVENICKHENQEDLIDYVEGVLVWEKVMNKFTCKEFLKLIDK